MANILILGAGAMGTAFAFPCSDNKHNVTIVGTFLENDFIEEINKTRAHPALNCEIPKSVKFYKFDHFKDCINEKVDLIVVAVISKGIDWACKELCKVYKRNIPILILTKGLAINGDKYEVLAHKIERLLTPNGINKINITAAGGPCLAKGLANRVNTSVVFANENINDAKKISELVSTNYYHVFTSVDVVGVEVCAAIKNIFSLAVGAAQGLCNPRATNEIKSKNYLNTAAALIQESVHEMTIFTEKLKGKKETIMGPAGIGDLYVSAAGGRNSKMGALIGDGMIFSQAKKNKMQSVTVEGAELIFEIGKKVKDDFDYKQLPLMIAMINSILEDKQLEIKWENFN
jgi:glycerol-3-phosphate dehydrogenase (NAD(P)+)